MTVMHMTKNVGKPYEGKLHVRFDEGELKVKQRPAKESLLEISPLLYNLKLRKLPKTEVFHQ